MESQSLCANVYLCVWTLSHGRPHPLFKVSNQDIACCYNISLYFGCVWRQALPMLEEGPLCSGKHMEKLIGTWLNVKCKSWGQAQPQASTFTCLSTHTHILPGLFWEELIVVRPSEQERWPEIVLWDSFIPVSLDVGNPVGMKMDLGSPFQPYGSLNCVQWIYLPHNRFLPCSCEVCSPTWGLLSLVYLMMLGKLLKLFGLDSKISGEWQSSLLPH